MPASSFFVPVTIDGTGNGAVGEPFQPFSREFSVMGDQSSGQQAPTIGQIWPRGNP